MQVRPDDAFVESVPVSSATMESSEDGGHQPASTRRSLSYKFQRLREELREAVESGEWPGKLPGERALARRFGVNAKTLSKALTDLAAEGLLERRIGRGTFVAGSAASEVRSGCRVSGRWLIICDDTSAKGTLIAELMRLNPLCHIVEGTESLRPSLLSQFAVVLDCATATPEAFYRRMRVRGMPIVTMCAPDREITTHTVRLDRTLAGFCLGRDMLLAGHRRLAAVGGARQPELRAALAQAVGRYAAEATVDVCAAKDVLTLIDKGITGIICDEIEAAAQVLHALEQAGVHVPMRVSVAAIGIDPGDLACSGIYLTPGSAAAALAEMLKDLPQRPMVSWLRGHFIDHGTMASPANIAADLGAGPSIMASDALAS
jgi:hypothetical protein